MGRSRARALAFCAENLPPLMQFSAQPAQACEDTEDVVLLERRAIMRDMFDMMGRYDTQNNEVSPRPSSSMLERRPTAPRRSPRLSPAPRLAPATSPPLLSPQPLTPTGALSFVREDRAPLSGHGRLPQPPQRTDGMPVAATPSTAARPPSVLSSDGKERRARGRPPRQQPVTDRPRVPLLGTSLSNLLRTNKAADGDWCSAQRLALACSLTGGEPRDLWLGSSSILNAVLAGRETADTALLWARVAGSLIRAAAAQQLQGDWALVLAPTSKDRLCERVHGALRQAFAWLPSEHADLDDNVAAASFFRAVLDLLFALVESDTTGGVGVLNFVASDKEQRAVFAGLCHALASARNGSVCLPWLSAARARLVRALDGAWARRAIELPALAPLHAAARTRLLAAFAEWPDLRRRLLPCSSAKDPVVAAVRVLQQALSAPAADDASVAEAVACALNALALVQPPVVMGVETRQRWGQVRAALPDNLRARLVCRILDRLGGSGG